MFEKLLDMIANILDPFGRERRRLKNDNNRRLDNLSRMLCDEASQWAGRRVTEDELLQIGKSIKSRKKRR